MSFYATFHFCPPAPSGKTATAKTLPQTDWNSWSLFTESIFDCILINVDKLIEERVTTKSLLTMHEIQVFDELSQQRSEEYSVRAVTTRFVVDRPIWSICPRDDSDRTKLLFQKIKKLKHVKFFKSQAASSWFHETDNASIVCSVSVTTEFISHIKYFTLWSLCRWNLHFDTSKQWLILLLYLYCLLKGVRQKNCKFAAQRSDGNERWR